MSTRTRADDIDGGRLDSLVRALRPRTPDVAVRKRAAKQLYDASIGDRVLVGVLAGAEEAVYHSASTRCVAAVELTDVGPNLGNARPLGQAVDDPERAFDHVAADWAWTNAELRR
ncbi:MAG: hypothetical protein ABEH90_11270 [Halolamina sp.]